MAIALTLLGFWATENVLHNFDTLSTTIAAIALMLLQFVVSFGFISPANAPQNMIAYGTGTFDSRDFVRTGLVITLAAFSLLGGGVLTYWPWMGYMTQ